jgi:hypothetical protein
LNEIATNENLEIQTSLRTLNLIARVQRNMFTVNKVFNKRFDLKNYSDHLGIQNGTSKKETGERGRVLNENILRVSLNTSSIFDTDSGFGICYVINFFFLPEKLTISSRIELDITAMTPSYDPWSITIAEENFEARNLENAETQIDQGFQTHIEHATSFDIENPLRGTVFQEIYPKIWDMFTQSKWNKCVEDRSVREQLSPEFLEQFGREVSTIRHEVYALGKAQSAEEHSHE